MLKTLTAGTLAGALVAALLTTPAAAHTGGPPWGPDLQCAYDDYVISCFEQDGDDFWVYDREEDKASAHIDWFTDYGRTGDCTNSHGVVTWHECTFDMAEGHYVYWSNWTWDKTTGVKILRSENHSVPITSS